MSSRSTLPYSPNSMLSTQTFQHFSNSPSKAHLPVLTQGVPFPGKLSPTFSDDSDVFHESHFKYCLLQEAFPDFCQSQSLPSTELGVVSLCSSSILFLFLLFSSLQQMNSNWENLLKHITIHGQVIKKFSGLNSRF